MAATIGEQSPKSTHSPEFDVVVEIAYQASQVRTGSRDDTLFYKVVLAGNVDVIRQVVQYMQDNGMTETLHWLLDHDTQTKTDPNDGSADQAKLCDACEEEEGAPWTIRGMSILMLLLNIILTPLFYAVHILFVAIFNQDQRRISRNIHLPLAFAAFSREEQMLEYFFSLGLSLRSADQFGNNVFHYISDLSATARSRALEVFQDMVGHLDEDELRELITRQRNASGITPLEYAAKFGSPLFLDCVLRQPNLLLHREFAVSRHGIQGSSAPATKLRKDKDCTKIELADVTMYEAGSMCHRSMLLNLLSDRGVAKMSAEDLKLYECGTFIGNWMALKVKQMFTGVLLFQIIDVIVTALVFVVLLRGANSSQIDVWVNRKHTGIILQEINSLHDNTKSTVLKHPNEVLDRLRLDKQLAHFNITLPVDRNIIEGLLPSATDPKDIDTITDDLSNEITANSGMDALSDILIKHQLGNWKALGIWRHAKDIRDLFISKFLTDKPIFRITSDNALYKYYDYQEVLHALTEEWGGFSLDALDYTFQPSEPIDQLLSLICFHKSFFNDTDVWYRLQQNSVPDDVYEYETSCDLGMLWSFHYDDCNSLDADDLFQKLASWNKLDFNRIMWSYVTVGVLACMYLFLDTLERCVFIITRCSHQKTAKNMLSTILGSKVPGSYARRQMNVITFCMILFYVLTYYYATWFAGFLGTDSSSVLETARYVFVVGLVIRFLLHIHSMRLLPGIGHFVITTFMMAANLVHFSAILGLVIVIFAALFHILIDDPVCPVEKLDGFNSFLESTFNTFKLTFAHGDFDPYYSSTPVMVTYAFFVVIVSLLLLNLIIAIMSTTATEIMCRPWKEALWRVEWLDEATSVEYALCVLTSACGVGVMEYGCMSHNVAGYVVKQADGEVRVYVPQVTCPAVDPLTIRD